MNVYEKVATLQALLERVQRNAAHPRPSRASAVGEAAVAVSPEPPPASPTLTAATAVPAPPPSRPAEIRPAVRPAAPAFPAAPRGAGIATPANKPAPSEAALPKRAEPAAARAGFSGTLGFDAPPAPTARAPEATKPVVREPSPAPPRVEVEPPKVAAREPSPAPPRVAEPPRREPVAPRPDALRLGPQPVSDEIAEKLAAKAPPAPPRKLATTLLGVAAADARELDTLLKNIPDTTTAAPAPPAPTPPAPEAPVTTDKSEAFAAAPSTLPSAEVPEPTGAKAAALAREPEPPAPPPTPAPEVVAAVEELAAPQVIELAKPAAEPLAAAAAEPLAAAVAEPLAPAEPKEPPKPAAEPAPGKSPWSETEPPAARPTSGWRIGLLAAVLVGAGVFIALRAGWIGAPTPPPPTPSTTATAVRTAPTTQPTVTASAAPSAVASAAPSASASAAPTSSAASPPAPTVDAAALPPTRGLVAVTTSTPADVYINGAYAGPANGAPIETLCGIRNIRVAKASTPPAAVPAQSAWLSGGQAVAIACRATTSVNIKPGPPPGPAPGPAPAPAPPRGEPY